MEKIRKIIHVDMDAFFASVEQRENPEFIGKPLIVGGNRDRGVVAAASYEARKFGIFSAMPVKIAKEKCSDLIIVPPNFDLYKSVSEQIRNIFLEFTDLVEPLSLDEAYLDVTVNKKHFKYATQIAKEIKKLIKAETNLTASAGVSFNKFLAKTASDINKPDGMFVITPEMAEQFIEKLLVSKFFGVGNVTAQKMQQLGIKNGKDLKTKELGFLVKNFGKNGQYFYNIARANDNRKVEPNKTRKSLGVERTFEKDITNYSEILTQINLLSSVLHKRIIKNGYFGKTLTLKIKFSDFTQLSKSKTISENIDNKILIQSIAVKLLDLVNLESKRIRLLGITVSNSNSKPSLQLLLNF
ncbi:MAG: DNA polymerase IV [Chlorobi bacterium]|nr:DNA polymerase IV [Chlorobiota bacterium]